MQEAARRRVFRVAGAYVAVAFAAVEGVFTVVDAGLLPEWGFRLALGSALMGFPVAMVLAWDYDITPRGIERTADDPPDEARAPPPLWRWLTLVLASLVVGVTLVLLR